MAGFVAGENADVGRGGVEVIGQDFYHVFIGAVFRWRRGDPDFVLIHIYLFDFFLGRASLDFDADGHRVSKK